MTFISYAICFALGGSFVLLFWKRARAPLPKQKHEKKLSPLQANNNLLKLDKLNLQNRNKDLVEIISQNQRSIENLDKKYIEIKKDIKTLINHQMTILEILSSVSNIHNQENIKGQIMITNRFAKKYNQYNPFPDSNQNSPK